MTSTEPGCSTPTQIGSAPHRREQRRRRRHPVSNGVEVLPLISQHTGDRRTAAFNSPISDPRIRDFAASYSSSENQPPEPQIGQLRIFSAGEAPEAITSFSSIASISEPKALISAEVAARGLAERVMALSWSATNRAPFARSGSTATLIDHDAETICNSAVRVSRS